MLLTDDLVVPDDGSSAPIVQPQKERCNYYPNCFNANCPFLHEAPLGGGSGGERSKASSIVCNKWLKGDCQKGDQCKFLHEYDYNKIPICSTFRDTGRCTTQRCRHRHPMSLFSMTVNSTGRQCDWYHRGFCKHGGNCMNAHELRNNFCPAFMLGFCPKGPNCPLPHPNFEKDELLQNTIASNAAAAAAAAAATGGSVASSEPPHMAAAAGGGVNDEAEIDRLLSELNYYVMGVSVCHRCGERNHKSTTCASPNPLPPNRQGKKAIVSYFVRNPSEWVRYKPQVLQKIQQQQQQPHQRISDFNPRYMAPPFFGQGFH